MKLAQIAERLGCELRGDGNVDIDGVAAIEDAGPGTITFFSNPRYRTYLKSTQASAVILATQEEDLPMPTLRAADPYLAFANALDLFYVPPAAAAGIHPTAVISASASVADDAAIGPCCVIGEGCVIGSRARLDAHVVLYPEVTIGDDFRAYAGVTIRERVRIGHRVILQSGCVIGSDGFGYVLGNDGKARKITQAGTVVIEDDVEIGANATIDRAAVGSTRIGAGVKIDNMVQIAHGCSIGESSAIAAQSGIAGSSRVGRWVRMGGQVGVAGHLTIGDGAQIAGGSGISNDVESGTTVAGYPAVEIHAWRRSMAALRRLPDSLKRLRRLEKGAAEKC